MSVILDTVRYRYPGGTPALDDVSISVNAGELLAVIGPSGSGKSTVLKLVAGLLSGYEGRILIEGSDVANVPIHLRHVGMVFQSYALFPHLDVLDNVAYGLKLRKVAAPARRKRAQELLDMVGLGEYAGRPVTQLSGGQQQRVALARALAIEPRALLLDEPLSALDAGVRGHLRDQIRQIQQRFGTTTLLVTHDQEEALTMADRVAVLHAGRVAQIGTPQQLYRAPTNRAVAAFVGLSTLFPARVVAADRIDLGFAQWATPTGHRPVGSAVFALVRPEDVAPDPPEGTPNRIAGHCGACRYLGPSTRYDFHINGAPVPLLAEAAQPAQVSISVAPQHIRLLDD